MVDELDNGAGWLVVGLFGVVVFENMDECRNRWWHIRVLPVPDPPVINTIWLVSRPLSWKKKLINFRIIRNVCKINYLGKIALEN